MAEDSPPARLTEAPSGGDLGGAHATAPEGEDDPDIHPADDQEGPRGPNVAVHQRLRNGDAAAALARSEAVASARFRTSWVHQGYIEPQSAMAWPEPEGDLVIQASTQGAFMARDSVAQALGLPLERVRVRPSPIGGAFGGKLVMSEP